MQKPQSTDQSALEHDLDSILDDVVGKYAADVDLNARFPAEAIDALRGLRLLGGYVPVRHGGLGLDLRTLCRISERLGTRCASTAMIFAMHQIQVACLVHHASDKIGDSLFLRRLAMEQLLLASATTEIGTGGDLGVSVCAVEELPSCVRIEKQAPVISYAEYADAILVTARRSSQSAANDQVQVVVDRSSARLKCISTWDSLGFRGTCSLGFHLTAEVPAENVQSTPFSTILAQTMQPVSHLLWGSLWLGIAQDAASRARRAVRASAKTSAVAATTQLRLAEMDESLFRMRSTLRNALDNYQSIIDNGAWHLTQAFSFGTSVNNIKLICSEAVVDVVGKALVICGISGYRNDSEYSLGRQLRDAYGALLMVNNDRIRSHNAAMQLAQR